MEKENLRRTTTIYNNGKPVSKVFKNNDIWNHLRMKSTCVMDWIL
jgi:hypothetical protein